MKKILAVSGGVDSMVLFDVFKNEPNILVAHFNHGTRESASDDEGFVRKKCKEFGVDIIVKNSKLGADISEEKAREARYDFLFSLREKILKRVPNETVMIYTAHHLDDLVESVFINLLRGTGWRGLTPFSMPNIFRPFLQDDILLPESKADILVIKKLYFSQQKVREEIEKILTEILPEDGIFKRAWFKNMDDKVAIEILKFAFLKVGIKLTEPQLKDFLNAIRTYAPEKKFNLPEDKLITLHKDWFKI